MEESVDQVANEYPSQSSGIDELDDAESPVSTGELEIQVVTNTEEFDSLKSEWNYLVNETGSFIFQTFEWNRIWWEYFGEGKKLHIVVITHDERIVGIIPLFWDTINLLKREIYSCLRFLGSTVSQPEGETLMGIIAYSDYLDAIVRPGYEASVYDLLIQHLLQEMYEYDEIILDEVPEDSSLCHYLIPALEEYGFDYTSEVCSKSPIINLNCSWDEYLDSMSKKSRYNARRNLKMSTRESHKIFDILDVGDLDEVVPVYDEMVKLHQQRWNNLGYPGTFAEKRMYDFLKKVSIVFYQRGWLQFKMAVPTEAGNDNCVAIDMVLRYGERVYMLHRAMDDESPFTNDSPGNVLLYRILKEVADGKTKIFDFLRGVQEFKMRTADDIIANKRIQIRNPNRKTRLNDEIIKFAVRMKRRVKVERFQFNLFFRNTSVGKGLKNYYSFLYSRINKKLASDC